MKDVKARLEISAIQFLLWQKRCALCTMERGHKPWLGNPDVLGVTQSRHIIEVEIKQSVSDFRANKDKKIQKHFERFPEQGPNYFYYMVSSDIAEKVLPEVEPKFGLMTLESESGTAHKVIKRADKIHKERASIERAIGLVRDQSGTILKLMDKLYYARANYHNLFREFKELEISIKPAAFSYLQDVT